MSLFSDGDTQLHNGTLMLLLFEQAYTPDRWDFIPALFVHAQVQYCNFNITGFSTKHLSLAERYCSNASRSYQS
jgi:transposase